ncbi:glycosyltransferase [Planosporangium mesophilum]|uniref:glycosyltransferase n=1 Tax=Planosporangium mesophilum TaxID=689768 RepID=UPI00143A580C|nr:glycosyltransferase [Planosporangium mesophilum]NJC81145.1 glycosyltransferase [Planosporangium mesophilum]
MSEHVDITLLTSDRDLGCRDPYPGLSGTWVNRDRTRVFYLNTGSLSQWLRLWRELRATPFDLLYVNSLWSPQFTQVPVLAVRLGLIRAGNVLVAPRGELSPGALALKSWKKRLFLKWWGPFLKRMGVIWHATADKEASEIRAVCPWAHIEINQNQVALPPEPLSPSGAYDGPPRLVFISRVSPKKNLDLVLQALNELSTRVELDIYGPLEDAAHWKHCEAIIRRLPASVRVRYRGEVSPEDVRRTFHDYDAFVFPTRGENFGHVIAESLSASCPVVCSDRTPWTEVLESGGGRVVRDLTAGALAAELERITAMTPDERLRARCRAGETYRSWRRKTPDRNILDLARQTLTSVAR